MILMELKMIINFEELENFCKANDFIIINDELLKKELCRKKCIPKRYAYNY